MLNHQTPLPPAHEEVGTLDVHSIFLTIQGEGPFAGHPAVFIRLHGCNLQCPGCDTEYTETLERLTPEMITRRISDTGHTAGLIVITGGEPFRQNITATVWHLLNNDYYVQVESNGVFAPSTGLPIEDDRFTLVVSPKTAKIHPITAKAAHVYKYVISDSDVADDGLPVSALHHPLPEGKTVARPPEGWVGAVYINPMDEYSPRLNKNNYEAAVNAVLNGTGNWSGPMILGVQMHKIVGLP